VDTPNGALFGLRKAAAKDFDSSLAGSYKAAFYQKIAVSMGRIIMKVERQGSAATLSISPTGHLTIKTSVGTILFSAILRPVADAAYLYGSAELATCTELG